MADEEADKVVEGVAGVKKDCLDWCALASVYNLHNFQFHLAHLWTDFQSS